MCRIALKMFEHRSWIVGNATVGTNESTPVRGKKTDALKICVGDNMSGAIKLKRVRLFFDFDIWNIVHWFHRVDGWVREDRREQTWTTT